MTLESRIPSFETKQLIFRPLTMADKFDIYSLYTDTQVLQLEQSLPLKTVSDAEKLIKNVNNPQLTPHSIHWGVELKENHKVIGTCGFKNWDQQSRHAEIGGHLSSNYWGNGFAKETLIALLKYGFTTMNLNKVYAYTNCQNVSVLKIMDKFNFKLEGTLSEHQLVNNTLTDIYIYSMKRTEAAKYIDIR